jgi:hypothetical protein
MSELTPCNYCSLQGIKNRNKGKKVTLERDEYGWLAVHVDGEKAGMSFMEITDHCVC